MGLNLVFVVVELVAGLRANSLALVAVIPAGTWGLRRDSFDLVLDAVPRNIDPGVILTAHLVMPGPRPKDDFLDRAARRLRGEQGIHHVTLRTGEGRPGRECPQALEGSL